MSRIISITIDYKIYDESLTPTFEAALSDAISSTQFEFNGNKTYKRKFLLTENAETIYAEWLLIMATVYNTLALNLCVYSSYTCIDYFGPMD